MSLFSNEDIHKAIKYGGDLIKFSNDPTISTEYDLEWMEEAGEMLITFIGTIKGLEYRCQEQKELLEKQNANLPS